MTAFGRITAWRFGDGRPVPIHRPQRNRWTLAVGDVDGRPAALTAGAGNVLQLWDLLAGRPIIDRMVGHTDDVQLAVLGYLNGRPTAVTSDNRGEALLWDLHTGQRLGPPMTAGMFTIRTLALGPKGSDTAVITADGIETRLWSVGTFQQCGDALVG